MKFCKDIKISTEKKPLDIGMRSLLTFIQEQFQKCWKPDCIWLKYKDNKVEAVSVGFS